MTSAAGAPDTPSVQPGAEGATVGLQARRAAWQAIRRVHTADAWSTVAVDAALRRAGLDARDRSFAASLAYETLRWEGTLDWALTQVLTRPLQQVEPALLDVLRLGAWQVLFGGVPDRAAVATSVELARAEIGSRVAGFTNGVLRNLARRRERLPWPPAQSDRGLGLRLGYPPWVVGEARRRFAERASAVLEAGNDAPGLTLRASGDREALLHELRQAGVDAEPGAHAPEAVRARGAQPAALAAVAEGRATPQDEASMLVSRAVVHGLDGADLRVLDACAAPGGKTAHLAGLGARVWAGELHPSRAGLVAKVRDRLGLGGRVHVVVADAGDPPWRAASFDAVLLDAPCTGLGVVRRRPELRWRRAPEDPARLADLQLVLLERCSELVRPGGRLVYSVCTWPEAETVEVARAFLAAHGDRFTPWDVAPALSGAGTRHDGDPGVQLAPDVDGTDGMYIAAFTRGDRPSPPAR